MATRKQAKRASIIIISVFYNHIPARARTVLFLLVLKLSTDFVNYPQGYPQGYPQVVHNPSWAGVNRFALDIIPVY